MVQFIVSKLRCLRCSHEWILRKEEPPKFCPKCKSPYWDRPRKDLKNIDTLSIQVKEPETEGPKISNLMEKYGERIEALKLTSKNCPHCGAGGELKDGKWTCRWCNKFI